MKPALLMVLAALAAIMVSCSSTPPQVSQLIPAPPPSPTFAPLSEPPYLVVKGMYSALNNGDIDGALNFFSDDAIYIIRSGPDEGIHVGKDEIRLLLEPDIQNRIFSVISDFETATDILDLQHQRIQNAESISNEEEAISVINGKITGMGIDPESLIRYTFYELNQKQSNRAIVTFTTDALCAFISDAPLNGRSAIQGAFQGLVSAGDVFEISDIDAQEYYRVTWTLTIYDAHGKMINQIRRTSDVESGKIVNCYLPK